MQILPLCRAGISLSPAVQVPRSNIAGPPMARGHGVDLFAFSRRLLASRHCASRPSVGPSMGVVVSTEPRDDLSCLTTPGVPETGCCPCR